MKQWRCKICGYIHEGDSAPDKCPVCAAPAEDFVENVDVFTQKPLKESIRRIIIIGAGAAGIEAAKTIRSQNKNTEVLVFTEEPYSFYSRIHLSAFISDKTEIADITIHAESWFKEQNIIFKSGTRIANIDHEQHEVRDDRNKIYQYDKLIIASGAIPAIPPIKGVDLPGVFFLRNMNDALKLKDALSAAKKAIVIGGGILGIEVASGLQKLGISTHIFEALPFLMHQQLDEQGAGILADILGKRGISIHTDKKVIEIKGSGSVSEIIPEKHPPLPADLVIVTTGIVPNVTWLKTSGLEINKGVVVDQYMESSLSGIYAAGDVAEFQNKIHGIWPAAVDQGIIAGLNAMGIREAYKGTTPLHILKVAGLEMTSIGQKYPVDPEDQELVHLDKDQLTYAKLIHNGNILKGSISIGHAGIGFRLERLIKKESPIAELLPDFRRANWDILKKRSSPLS